MAGPQQFHPYNFPFMQGGGQMGELIRNTDWQATPLGDPAGWPSALRYSVNMLLNISFPVLICWGKDYIQLYNDAFRPINGESKHPQALGGSALDTYAEIWDTIGPMFENVMSGKTISFPDFMVVLNRYGYPEDCYFDFSYSPIFDDDGIARGIRVLCVETTSKVRAQRSMETTSDELSATNEELAAANEEFATTNEELIETQKLLESTVSELAESDSRFRNLVRDATVGIILLTGPEMKVEIVNDAYGRLIGLTAAELYGRRLFDVIPASEPAFRPVIESVRQKGEPVYLYGHPYFAMKDGVRVEGFLDIVYQPYREADGHITGVMVLCQDVTEQVVARRKREEYARQLQLVNEELKASESRLRMAIAATRLGTWEYNVSSGDMFWSPECYSLYGLPPGEQVTFEAFAEQIHPDDRDRVGKEINRCIAPGSDGRYEISYRIIRFDNAETRWIKVHGTVNFNDKGEAGRFIGTVLDITDVKEAEEKSAKLAAIITSSDDAIISKTLNSVITSWNGAAERIFGYTADEIIGQTIYKLIPPDRQQEEPRILARLKGGERVEHFETKRITKDGRLIDVSLTISAMKDNEGNIIGLSKIARDITERKLDEVRKNDFIGMVSHELKTPLTSLNAIMQVAGAKLKNSDDAFLISAMGKANVQLKKMTSMINGFLNISRLEAGKILIHKQPFDMNGLLHEIADETRLVTTGRNIFVEQCPAVEVIADREKISSVVSNLVSNAIKYSRQDSDISIACRVIGKTIEVSVSDQGIGINLHDLDKIFDRYYRIEDNNTRHISGFGIGLYLSAEIIKRHDGRIWAESEIGKGSVFHFSLPL